VFTLFALSLAPLTAPFVVVVCVAVVVAVVAVADAVLFFVDAFASVLLTTAIIVRIDRESVATNNLATKRQKKKKNVDTVAHYTPVSGFVCFVLLAIASFDVDCNVGVDDLAAILVGLAVTCALKKRQTQCFIKNQTRNTTVWK
jgi:hypothetical protein